MKKLLLSAAAVLAAITAWADVNVVQVWLADKSNVEIVITDDVNLSFTDTNLLAKGGEKEVEIPRDQVVRFTHIYDATMNVGEIAADNYEIKGGKILFHGLPAGSVIEVFTLGGATVSRNVAEGDFEISLDTLEKGIYLVKANETTLKITNN